MNKKQKISAIFLIFVLLFSIFKINLVANNEISAIDILNKSADRQTKSFINETSLSAEEYYEAALKGELVGLETKKDPFLFSSLKLIKGKSTGWAEGGVYKDISDEIWIVKKAQDPIYEYLGTKVMDLLIGPFSPEVKLFIDQPEYTASKLLPGFVMKDDVRKNLNKLIVGELELEIAMDLMCLSDRHGKNLGYIDTGDTLHAARVDFDSSFSFESCQALVNDSKVDNFPEFVNEVPREPRLKFFALRIFDYKWLPFSLYLAV